MIIVRLKEGESLDPQELYDFCEKRMAKFMIPKYMKIVDEIPKTATERIEKYKLRDSIDREKLTVVYK